MVCGLRVRATVRNEKNVKKKRAAEGRDIHATGVPAGP